MTSFLTSLLPSNNFNFEQSKNKRKLEERSHLTVEFPQTNNRIFRTHIPFLENPQISEAGSNSLQEYNLMGRAGSLYAYGGSESRAFDITFNISLLHLLHLNSTEGIADKFLRHFSLFFADKQQAKERFDLRATVTQETADTALEMFNSDTAMAGPTLNGDSLSVQEIKGYLNENEDRVNQAQNSKLKKADMSYTPEGFPHAQTHRKFYASFLENITNVVPSDLEQTIAGLGSLGGLNPLFSEPDSGLALDKLINLVYVWINLVRATCLNNSGNTVQGPPIVRLTHGPMYNNIPCVVRDYSISILDEAGFDISTLTPKRIEISMTLSEMRTGDFGSFEEGYLETGDNLAGWEAIISNNNADPYNGAITEQGIQIGQND